MVGIHFFHFFYTYIKISYLIILTVLLYYLKDSFIIFSFLFFEFCFVSLLCIRYLFCFMYSSFLIILLLSFLLSNHSVFIFFVPISDLAAVFITSLISFHRFSLFEISVIASSMSNFFCTIAWLLALVVYLFFCFYVTCLYFYFLLQVFVDQ